jgi:hypothetical protein
MANTMYIPPTAATLPNEILTQIFRNLLLMKENVTFNRPVLDKDRAIADIESMIHPSAERVTVYDLKATKWFQDAYQSQESQAGIWTERKAISNIDTRFMRVNRHWAAVGHGILRREQEQNHFIEVTTSISMFSKFSFDLVDFGLKAWFVNKSSKRPDPVMKISIKRDPRFASPATLREKPNPCKLLLRLEDANDFGRFLMLQSNTASWKYQWINLEICRTEVPGFCDADTAVTRLYKIPFSSGLRRQLQVCIPPSTKIPATIVEEQTKLNAYFRHNYDERDVYSAGGALEHMLGEYQQSLKTGDVQVSERILRETIQSALTVLVTRFPKYGPLNGNRDMRHLGTECYLLQVLRFSAYELSEMHTFLAAEGSPSARHDHTLHALQCMVYALGLQHCDIPQRSAWRGLC